MPSPCTQLSHPLIQSVTIQTLLSDPPHSSSPPFALPRPPVVHPPSLAHSSLESLPLSSPHSVPPFPCRSRFSPSIPFLMTPTYLRPISPRVSLPSYSSFKSLTTHHCKQYVLCSLTIRINFLSLSLSLVTEYKSSLLFICSFHIRPPNPPVLGAFRFSRRTSAIASNLSKHEPKRIF